MTVRATGIAFAFATAVISGISIYVNGRGVRHFSDPTVYTTAKNLVAGVLLVLLAVIVRSPQPAAAARSGRPTRRQWLAMFGVGVIGGSVPFVLFFEGLARAEATQASFIQKTLVIWVAFLAVPLLHERFGRPHLLAVVLLIAGQAYLVGHAGTIAFGTGETMILAATLLWAVEVVYVKKLVGPIQPRLLAAARMGFGTVLLLCWVAVSGRAGALTGLDAKQWEWVLLTGLLLSAYVATWYAALARAQAVDVTAVLVFGAVITALLSGVVDGATVSAFGVGLVALGTAVVAVTAFRRPAVTPEPSPS
jgi:drug/metabolite transporter (DMT)-like permease